ncbi:hypothetical protein TURU_081877 [Turdus rufiventris]|nr:hypothetical protein TURU_081877 [Turdus rufiventris]
MRDWDHRLEVCGEMQGWAGAVGQLGLSAAQGLLPPLIISENTPIAKAIALPTQTMEQVMSIQDQQMLSEGTDMETAVLWTQYIGHDQPQISCSLTYNNKTITILGMLDTGADVTVVSYAFRPKEWNLITPLNSLTEIGGATLCLQSEHMILVTGPEGKIATIRFFIVQKPITVWERDLLSQGKQR